MKKPWTIASRFKCSSVHGRSYLSHQCSPQVLRIRKRLYGRDNAEVINTTANQAIIYEKLLMNKNAHKLHM